MIMRTINELIMELSKIALEGGYGNKPIYLDAFSGEQGKQYMIDSM